MRNGAVCLAAAAVLAACSAPAEVIVSRADDVASGPDTAVTVETTTTTPARQATDSADGTALLLTPDDVPEWVHSGPISVPAEPPLAAEDCDAIDVAWSAAARAGARVRGTVGTARFRNTVVALPDEQAAASILDAAKRVPAECPTLRTSGNGLVSESWTEPLRMAPASAPSVGFVLGDDAAVTAYGFWQAGAAVVVLEVSGDMWEHIDPLVAAMAARVDRSATPGVTTTEPGTRSTTTEPGTRPANTEPVTQPENTVPAVTVRPGDTAPPSPDEFPPSHADWADDPLARLAPHPDELGVGWEFDYGSVNEAEPADPDDMIDGCDVPAPPTPAGISLAYEQRSSGDYEEMEIELGVGTPADFAPILDAFRDITECDLSSVGYTDGLTIVDGVTFDGASDSVVLTGAFGSGDEFRMTFVIAAAAYDDVIVFVFRTAGDDAADAALAHAADTVRLVAAKR